jgi:hypothetical protein
VNLRHHLTIADPNAMMAGRQWLLRLVPQDLSRG